MNLYDWPKLQPFFHNGALKPYKDIQRYLEEHCISNFIIRSPLYTGINIGFFGESLSSLKDPILQTQDGAVDFSILHDADPIKIIQSKVRSLNKLCLKNDLDKILYIIERPFRSDLLFWLIENNCKISPKLIFDIYTDAENPSVRREDWQQVFEHLTGTYVSDVNHDEVISDKNYFMLLPNKITVYRGMSKLEYKSKNFGFSWTLDRKIAEFFAKRFIDGVVHKAVAKKSNIKCFSNQRSESELIIVNI